MTGEEILVDKLLRASAEGLAGTYVVFPYCISMVLLSFKRSSGIKFVPAGSSRVVAGLPYLIISALVGWWGIPWGIAWTLQSIAVCLGGGRDLTPIIDSLRTEVAGQVQPAAPARSPSIERVRLRYTGEWRVLSPSGLPSVHPGDQVEVSVVGETLLIASLGSDDDRPAVELDLDGITANGNSSDVVLAVDGRPQLSLDWWDGEDGDRLLAVVRENPSRHAPGADQVDNPRSSVEPTTTVLPAGAGQPSYATSRPSDASSRARQDSEAVARALLRAWNSEIPGKEFAETVLAATRSGDMSLVRNAIAMLSGGAGTLDLPAGADPMEFITEQLAYTGALGVEVAARLRPVAEGDPNAQAHVALLFDGAPAHGDDRWVAALATFDRMPGWRQELRSTS